VLAGCPTRTSCAAFTSIVRRLLHDAGFDVQVRHADHRADLTFSEQVMTEPDPLAFLHAAGGPSPPFPRPAPAPAAALARQLDQQLTHRLNALPIGTPTTGELASARLGCRRQPPLSFDADLAALCPQK
jgi:hypothetical protein